MAHTKQQKTTSIGRYIAVMLLLCLLPTLLRSGILLPAAIFIEGDVLRESDYATLSGISDFISCVALFSALGASIAAIFEKSKRALSVSLGLFAFCELTAALLAAFWQYQLRTQPSLTVGYFALYALSGLLIDLLITVVVLLVAARLRKSAEEKGKLDFAPHGALFRRDNPANLAGLFATLLVFLSTIVRELAVTIPLLLEYGAPINRTELIHLAEPYLMALIYLLAGYAVASLVLMITIKEKTKTGEL